jgi:hypothetical protein
MVNNKSQIPKTKQILITQIQNSKRDFSSISPFGSLDIRILKLFACSVKSMRPYQGYLILGIWNLFGACPERASFHWDSPFSGIDSVKRTGILSLFAASKATMK